MREMDSGLQGGEETPWMEWIISDNNTEVDLVDFFFSHLHLSVNSMQKL